MAHKLNSMLHVDLQIWGNWGKASLRVENAAYNTQKTEIDYKRSNLLSRLNGGSSVSMQISAKELCEANLDKSNLVFRDITNAEH